MAYISQEMKKERMPGIKAVLKEYGYKASVSVSHSSKLCVTLSEGPADLEHDVNIYHIDTNHEGKVAEFLNKLLAAMRGTDWYDDSDVQTDYFDVAFYTAIDVGTWNKPYKVLEAQDDK